MPRFYGYNTYGEPDDIKISDGKNINIKFAGKLRNFQKPIVEKYLKVAKTKGCGLLEIHCGAGKTVMGLKIISELKKKTLVIVHKEFLLEQWKETNIEMDSESIIIGDILFDLRTEISKSMEESRNSGDIKSSLEASINLSIDDEKYILLRKYEEELKFIFICSDLTLTKSEDRKLHIDIKKNVNKKCERCWHFSETVGSIENHENLCIRCFSNVFEDGETRRLG